jgi:hypothetical protein
MDGYQSTNGVVHEFSTMTLERDMWTTQSMMRTGWRLRWRIFLAEKRTEQLEDEPIQCLSLLRGTCKCKTI